MQFLRKRTNTNPKRGPIHYRSPARMVWRVIRGMLPHKTKRGAAAMEHLQVFEGVPAPYDKVKRAVIPAALKVLRTNPSRKFTRVGDLATLMGWSHNELIGRLEAKRKTKSAAFHTRQKALTLLKSKVFSISRFAILTGENCSTHVCLLFFALCTGVGQRSGSAGPAELDSVRTLIYAVFLRDNKKEP
jgi:hypothetical protein